MGPGRCAGALLDEAEQAFTQAIAIAPTVGFAHNNLGEVRAWRATWKLLRDQDPTASAKEAQAALQQATTLLPGLAQPWANLGQVHQTRGRVRAEAADRDPKPVHRARHGGAGARAEAQPVARPGVALAGRDAGRGGPLEPAGHGLRRGLRARGGPFQKALELEPENLEQRLAFGAFLREWATWRERTGTGRTAADSSRACPSPRRCSPRALAGGRRTACARTCGAPSRDCRRISPRRGPSLPGCR